MELTIQAKPREILGKRNSKLRKQGTLPAVVYGRGKDSASLEINAREFMKVYRKAGKNTLISLVIDGAGEKKVLIHEVAKHFMKDEAIHVDFYEVDLTRKIHAKVPVHFVGVSPAVKEQGGVLVKNLTEVEVEALPTDLPQFIEVALESLKNFDDRVRVSDLKVAQAVKILSHAEDVIITVQAPRSEEELKELEKSAGEEEKAAIEEMAAKEAEAKGVVEEDEKGEKKPEKKEEAPSPEKKEAK